MSKKNKGAKKHASQKQIDTRIEKMLERAEAHRLASGDRKFPTPKPKRRRVQHG